MKEVEIYFLEKIKKVDLDFKKLYDKISNKTIFQCHFFQDN